MSESLTMQVLVATMNANTVELVKKMNLQSEAIIANQCGNSAVESIVFNNNIIKSISTQTKGVGVNRNIALHWASADILLCADDDISYNDGYKEAVIDAFQRTSDADAIIFGMHLTKNGKIYQSVINKDEKLVFHKCLRYGTYVVAVRNKFVKKKNIHFTELFGGGSRYGSGEDSLFILDLFKNNAKVYTSSYILGRCSKDKSTWFEGYTDKFFYDKGAWLSCAFPKYRWILKWYFGYRLSKKTGVDFFKVLDLLEKGICGFDNLISYDENRFR